MLTDRRTNRSELAVESPIARVTPVIDETTIGQAVLMFQEAIEHDEQAAERREMRSFYFGDGEPGSSSRAFVAAIDALIADRREQLRHYDVEGTNMEAGG
ncbi:hypothetical protein F7P83_07400 [Brevibacterium luteolum]|nr:hypothetical protein [Brevibacterium luteolum]